MNASRRLLMILYAAFACVGAIVPWYFNLSYMMASHQLLTPQGLIAAGFTTPLTSSLTSDFLLGTTPVLIWMMVEARRLGMRYRWLYLASTFLVSFAFACPLFLCRREACLAGIANSKDKDLTSKGRASVETTAA